MLDTVMLPSIEHNHKEPVLEFLWLELTHQCNLKCLHCYSESSPFSTELGHLDETKYLNLLEEAYDIGCRQVQFIGGEPTLNKSLSHLIAAAAGLGYELIEVFTNLVSLGEALIETFVRYNVAVASSVYASNPEIHDAITQNAGSHRRTMANIQRLLDRRLRVRASVILMKENAEAGEATAELLHGIGVSSVGFDHVREFGRGCTNQTPKIESLCGNCANKILAIGPDGVVAPCIMSKHLAVGSVLESSLSQIALSEKLFLTRKQIGDATTMRHLTTSCQPDANCIPNCAPSYNCSPCSPNSSQPCNPNGFCQPSRR